jgi:hypothetical protein
MPVSTAAGMEMYPTKIIIEMAAAVLLILGV